MEAAPESGIFLYTVDAMNHEYFMYRCLQLAESGRRSVGNGALVGSVLVRNSKILTEAIHKEYGKSHAERALLENFEHKIESEDILYVNLEPCCHQGKTPPCTDIIIQKGIKHVVFGMVDPDPRVAGQGIGMLRKAEIEVIGPVLRSECERLNIGFITVRTIGRPYITLKRAQACDGSIANDDGSPKKITNDEQNTWSHHYLRSKADGIVVGVQTIINDDPQLSIRFDQKKHFIQGIKPLWRIIFDPHLRIPIDSRVCSDELRTSTIVITGPNVDQKVVEELSAKSVLVFPVSIQDQGFSWPELWNVLLTPHGDFKGITTVLVEGGAKTWSMFKDAGYIDEEVTLIGKA